MKLFEGNRRGLTGKDDIYGTVPVQPLWRLIRVIRLVKISLKHTNYAKKYPKTKPTSCKSVENFDTWPKRTK